MTLMFHFIYGMSSFPLTNSYFSRWLEHVKTTNQYHIDYNIHHVRNLHSESVAQRYSSDQILSRRDHCCIHTPLEVSISRVCQYTPAVYEFIVYAPAWFALWCFVEFSMAHLNTGDSFLTTHSTGLSRVDWTRPTPARLISILPLKSPPVRKTIFWNMWFWEPRVQTNLMFSSWIWRYWRVITGIIPQVQQVTSHPSELWYRKGSTPITHLNHCKSRSVVDQKPVDLVSYMCIPLATWVSPEIQRRPSALGLGRSCPANCRHFMWLGPGKFVHLWPSNPWNLWGNLGKWAVKSLRYLDVYTPVLG